MVSDLGVSASLLRFHDPGTSVPPPGPLGRVPRLHRYHGRSDFLPPVTPRSLPPRGATTAAGLCSLPAGGSVTGRALDLLTGSSTPEITVETTGPPRFLRNPHAYMPSFLRPRWDLHARPLRRGSTAFRNFNNVGSHDRYSFRGSITQPARSLSTLSDHGYPLMYSHPRLASGCWPNFAGRDWLPAGLLRKVSAMWSA